MLPSICFSQTAAIHSYPQLPTFPFGKTAAEIIGLPRNEIDFSKPIQVGDYEYTAEWLDDDKVYILRRFDRTKECKSVLYFDENEKLMEVLHDFKDDEGQVRTLRVITAQREGEISYNVLGTVSTLSPFFPNENFLGKYALKAQLMLRDLDGNGTVDQMILAPEPGLGGGSTDEITPKNEEMMLYRPKTSSKTGVQLRQ